MRPPLLKIIELDSLPAPNSHPLASKEHHYACIHVADPRVALPPGVSGALAARMEYVGRDQFNMSYMRHTGKWWEVYPDMSLDECIEAIRDDPLFTP